MGSRAIMQKWLPFAKITAPKQCSTVCSVGMMIESQCQLAEIDLCLGWGHNWCKVCKGCDLLFIHRDIHYRSTQLSPCCLLGCQNQLQSLDSSNLELWLFYCSLVHQEFLPGDEICSCELNNTPCNLSYSVLSLDSYILCTPWLSTSSAIHTRDSYRWHHGLKL